MKLTTISFLLMIQAVSQSVEANSEGMSNMPVIKPKKVYAVPTNESGEELSGQRGFGEKEPMVRMMNLMMVGGSGYEGMEMSAVHSNGAAGMPAGQQMQMAANDAQTDQPALTKTNVEKYVIRAAPLTAVVGANSVSFTIVNSMTGKTEKGLKIKALVFMTSMDMGTDEPSVRETAPGTYNVKATFAMKGPWALKIAIPGQEKLFKYDANSTK